MKVERLDDDEFAMECLRELHSRGLVLDLPPLRKNEWEVKDIEQAPALEFIVRNHYARGMSIRQCTDLDCLRRQIHSALEEFPHGYRQRASLRSRSTRTGGSESWL